jgi:hypothetical protein
MRHVAALWTDTLCKNSARDEEETRKKGTAVREDRRKGEGCKADPQDSSDPTRCEQTRRGLWSATGSARVSIWRTHGQNEEEDGEVRENGKEIGRGEESQGKGGQVNEGGDDVHSPAYGLAVTSAGGRNEALLLVSSTSTIGRGAVPDEFAQREWRRAAELTAAHVLPIRASYVTALAGLPALHKGPFDRALIAKAKAEGPLTSPLRDYSVQTILVVGGRA